MWWMERFVPSIQIELSEFAAERQSFGISLIIGLPTLRCHPRWNSFGFLLFPVRAKIFKEEPLSPPPVIPLPDFKCHQNIWYRKFYMLNQTWSYDNLSSWPVNPELSHLKPKQFVFLSRRIFAKFQANESRTGKLK